MGKKIRHLMDRTTSIVFGENSNESFSKNDEVYTTFCTFSFFPNKEIRDSVFNQAADASCNAFEMNKTQK